MNECRLLHSDSWWSHASFSTQIPNEYERSHASFSTWISNEYEKSHASCCLLWLAVLFFELQISWDIQRFCLTHSKQFAEIADLIQIAVMMNLILQHELDDTVKKIFFISFIEFWFVVSSFDQIFDYLLTVSVAAETAVKKFLDVE